MVKKKAKIEKSYRPVVLGFVLVILISLGFILYLSFAKTIIFIRLKPLNHSATFSFAVSETADAQETLEGRFLSLTLSSKKNFVPESHGEMIPAKANGVVKITNNYSKVQPLVATTRLNSKEGVLFRTKETVRVEPMAVVSVPVEADKPGKEGEIGPSTFTIVALWPGLQDKIFAASEAAMTGGEVQKTIITAEAIEQTKQQFSSELLAQAIAQFRSEAMVQYADFSFFPEAIKMDILSSDSSVEPGTEGSSFDLESKIRFSTFIFREQDMKTLAAEKMNTTLPPHQKLLENSLPSFSVSLDSIDGEKKSGVLTATSTQRTTLKLSAPLFDRTPITNSDKQTIRAYFLDFDEIENIEVQFQPFWVFRSPALADHIEIRLLE